MKKLSSSYCLVFCLIYLFLSQEILTTNGFLFKSSLSHLALQKTVSPRTSASSFPSSFKIASSVDGIAESSLPPAMKETGSLVSLHEKAKETLFKRAERFENDRTIWIGNIPDDITNEKFLELLNTEVNPHCKISRQRLIVYPNGIGKGFGFIELEKPQDVATAIDLLKKVVIKGQSLNPQRKVDVESKSTNKTLFLGGIDRAMNEDALRKLLNSILGQENAFTTVRISKDLQGEPRGFGFVELADSALAPTVIDKLNGYQYCDRFSFKAVPANPLPPRVEMNKNDRDFFPQQQPQRFMLSRSSSFAPSSSLPQATLRSPPLQQQQRQSSSASGSAVFDSDLFSLEFHLKPNPLTTIYLKNIAWNITQTFLHEMITDLIGYDKYSFLYLYPNSGYVQPFHPNTSMGFTHLGLAHVGFHTRESAQKAISELHGLEVNGRVLFAEYLNPYNIRFLKRKLGPLPSYPSSPLFPPQHQQQQQSYYPYDRRQQSQLQQPYQQQQQQQRFNSQQQGYDYSSQRFQGFQPPMKSLQQQQQQQFQPTGAFGEPRRMNVVPDRPNHRPVSPNRLMDDNRPPRQPSNVQVPQQQQQQQLRQSDQPLQKEQQHLEQKQVESHQPVEQEQPQPDTVHAEPSVPVTEPAPESVPPVVVEGSVAFFHDSNPSLVFPREDITEEALTPPPLQEYYNDQPEEADPHHYNQDYNEEACCFSGEDEPVTDNE